MVRLIKSVLPVEANILCLVISCSCRIATPIWYLVIRKTSLLMVLDIVAAKPPNSKLLDKVETC